MLEQKNNYEDDIDINNPNSEIKNLSSSSLYRIAQQLVNYQEMVIVNSKELKIQMEEASVIAGNIDTKMQEMLTQFIEQLNELRSEVRLLRTISIKIPDYIKAEVANIVPKLGQEINKLYEERLEDIANNIAHSREHICKLNTNATSSIIALQEISNNALDAFVAKSKQINSNYLKKIYFTLVLSSITAAIVGASSSYFMVKHFPTRVVIDNPNTITIDKNKVHILKRVRKK